ncbi:MAG TPA: hypothetical protein VIK61_04680 [Acidimicrobiia bacterium]
MKRRVAALLVSVVAIAIVPGSAQASPKPRVDMVPNGGPVMTGTTTVYAIFWESHAVDHNYDSHVKSFLKDLNGSSLTSLLKNYAAPDLATSAIGRPTNVTLGGTYHDTTTPLPTTQIGTPETDAAVLSEVQHAISVNLWPTGPHHLFLVFTGPGYQAGLTARLCGEHSFYFDAPTGYDVPYGFIPRPGLATCTPWGSNGINPTPSGSVRIDGALSTTWHEIAEALTDPVPRTGYDDPNYDEIADVCRTSYPNVTGGDNHNVVLNGHDYLVQGVWAIALGGCVVSGPPDLSADWIAFDFPAAPSTAITFTVYGGSTTSTLEVTDEYCQGDQFEIWDNGKDLGPTSYAIDSQCNGPNTGDAQTAFTDGGWSAGTFTLPAGTQSVSIQVKTNVTGSPTGTAAFAASAPTSAAQPGSIGQRVSGSSGINRNE